jgi:exonuclease SbcD
MRLLHTSDWHLGHQLHEFPRDYEHSAFLDWLLSSLDAEAIDALVVAGDVFDTANPPASAQTAFFDFLARARRARPDLDVVIVGGNHDSASRLDAPAALLRAMGVHVVGGLARREDGALDLDRLVVPLRDASGHVAAFVAAVPFLRPADLPPSEAEDRLIEGVRRVYAEVLDAARSRRRPGQAIVATGHCYMAGGALSELSERKVLGGNQHALPAAIFPEDVAYVALGHLHLAQCVGGRETVRYSGSPIPLSLTEAGYPHQVRIVEIEGEAATSRAVPIPRAVDVLRIPDAGHAPLADVLLRLRSLPAAGPTPRERLPWLEVHVSLPRPEPALRRQIEEAVDRRAARLVRIAVHATGDGAALADVHAGADLRELRPEDVFLRRWHQEYAEPPSAEILAAFAELAERAAHGVAP